MNNDINLNLTRCEKCYRVLPSFYFSKSNGNICFECIAAMRYSEQHIDREQRRYEIAKQMMPVLSERGYRDMGCFVRSKAEDVARNAVYYADVLIAELKKEQP